MNIGLDFDGVIADCGNLKRQGALKLFGVDIPEEKFKKEIVVGEGILTSEQYRNLQKQIYGTLELGLLAVPVKDALQYIGLLKKDGHQLTIVTSRFNDELHIAKEWLQNNKLDTPLIGCEGSKATYCKDLALDVFVDDDFDKLESLIGVVKHLFLFSWGYNKSVDDKGLVIRIESWQELYEKINTLSN